MRRPFVAHDDHDTVDVHSRLGRSGDVAVFCRCRRP
jgi:hypothetical protein